MKRFNILLSFLLIILTPLFGQSVYLKSSINHNISVSTQQMPEYFTYQILAPLSINYGPTSYHVNLGVSDFSIAKGQSFQGAVGYSFNDFLSFELKISSFNNSKKEFDASPKAYGFNGKTKWELCNYSFLPSIMLGQTFNKSAVNIFIYCGLVFNKLIIKALMNDERIDLVYEFKSNKIFSWGYGFEYSYAIYKHFSLFTNIGVNNSSYVPDRAMLISSSSSMDKLSTFEKEVKYVDGISSIYVNNNGTTDPEIPEIRIRETLKLNSIFLGIGIKYNLKK